MIPVHNKTWTDFTAKTAEDMPEFSTSHFAHYKFGFTCYVSRICIDLVAGNL